MFPPGIASLRSSLGVSKARAPWLGWILLLFLPIGEGRGVVVLPEGWYCGLLGPIALPAGVVFAR